eukprot:725018_1
MSTGLRSFIPYTLWRHGWKYTKPKYYRHLIHRHLKQNPTASAKSIQTLFTNGIQQYHEDIKFNADTVWSDGSFATIVSSIRQGIAKDIDDIKPHKFATNHLQAARELHDFFDGITEDARSKPTDDHRMLNTNQITDTQMAMDVDDFKNNNTNNTNNTHVMGPPPRLEATWSPLMDQTTIYAFPGRGNTYDTLQRGSQRGGDANRGNQIMNIGVDYGGYTRINQRARSRSRSR